MHTLQIEGNAPLFRVARFEGREGISELFGFAITIVSEQRDIAFDDIVGKHALLSIGGGAAPRHVHGLVAGFELGEDGQKLTAYEVTLVPDLFRLGQRQNSRIFQQLAVDAIVEEVLRDAGIPSSAYRLSLSGVHPPRDYCVQYRETDLAFVSRLLEEEGIHWFFEHDDASHVLVMGDSPSVNPPIAGDPRVLFRAALGAQVKEEHVSRFRYAERVRAGRVTLRDYDFKKPLLALETDARIDVGAELEIYDYPGDYETSAAGTDRAQIRLEARQAERRVGTGESCCTRFVAGATFTLAEHARGELDGEYLLTSVVHRGHEPSVDGGAAAEAPYANTFEVVPARVRYRAPLRTPRPTIKGAQTAIVVGPAHEEIHTDEHGRVKVQFHWDRLGKRDDKSSCWIRVGQTWAGAAYGAMWIPRVGHEVIVNFLEGDPDRPIIVGSVYHAANVPPYALPAEKTKSTIKSDSTRGGGGSNELRFEDMKGEEEVFLHAQKDWTIGVENDKDQTVGRDETLEVGRDRDKRVGRDQNEIIAEEKTIKVGKNHSETIAMNAQVTVGMNEAHTIGMNRVETVGMNRMVSVAMAESHNVGLTMSTIVGNARVDVVGGGHTELVGGVKSTTVGKGVTLTAGENVDVTVGADATETVAGQKTLTVTKMLSIQCGSASVTIDGATGDVTVKGANITLEGTGAVKFQGSTLTVKADGNVSVQAAGNVTVKGGNVAMN